MDDHPKVFISYSHQGKEYETRVFEFANKLRSEGIDAMIDVYEEAPSEGWPRWMEKQINKADYVLVVNSKSLYEKFEENGVGKGVTWEVNIIYQHLYDLAGRNSKFIPVYFEENEEQFILTPLKAYTYYNISLKERYDKLYWRLRGVSDSKKPPLGQLRPLPEKEQKTLFFSSPIDIDKWNDAGWEGIAYLFPPGMVPGLGLLFRNYEAAKEIFSDWEKIVGDDFADSFLKIDFIIPPFPNDCWVLEDSSRNNGKGYFVHIGPPVKEVFNSITQKTGLNGEELLLATVSRYQWMDEISDSTNRDHFMDQSHDGYVILPVGVIDKEKPVDRDNIVFDPNCHIRMKKISFKKGCEIKEDDTCKVVLEKPY